LGAQSEPLTIIEKPRNLPKKPSFRPSKWPFLWRKLKTAKNSKLPKLPENCFEPVGKRWVATDIHLDHTKLQLGSLEPKQFLPKVVVKVGSQSETIE
jgi:hypothetical protein